MFTKSDLRNGDFVEYRDGKIRMVVDDTLIGSNSFGLLTHYNDDLTATGCGCSVFDIMKVYRGPNTFDSAKEGIILFDRERDCTPKVVEMTIEEICEALGKEIKIVKEH